MGWSRSQLPGGDTAGTPEAHYREQDILTVAAALVPAGHLSEPYWDYAARGLLASIVAYTMDCLPPNERTMDSVMTLFQEIRTGRYERMIDELARVAPDNMAVSQFRLFNSGKEADRTWACIQGVLAEKLSVFAFSGAKALLGHPQKIDAASIGERKTALFLRLSDTDHSMDRFSR